MIIVSQSGEEIINFDLVAEIVVAGKSIVITNNIMKFSGQEIGTYSSEQRAKEVLNEIIKKLTNCMIYDVYQMPKE